MTHSYRRKLALGVAAALVSAPGAASTDGAFGATSTGSININASVPGRVRISGLSDINFAGADPLSEARNAQNLCVWSNTSTRRYSITATGNGASSAFTLSSGSLPTVPFAVRWSQTSGQSSGVSLTPGVPLTGLVSTAVNSDCTAGPQTTASMIVSLASPDLQGMTSGVTYNGTLTLVVAPE